MNDKKEEVFDYVWIGLGWIGFRKEMDLISINRINRKGAESKFCSYARTDSLRLPLQTPLLLLLDMEPVLGDDRTPNGFLE